MVLYNIFKANTDRYFRKLHNIAGDEDTQELDLWIIDQDLGRKYEDDNQESVKQQNEETKSEIIEIVKEEKTIEDQFDEINNSECFKILQLIHKILSIFIQ